MTRNRYYQLAIFFAAEFVILIAVAPGRAQPLRPPELPAPENVNGTAEPGYLGMVADDRQENGLGVRVKDIDPDSPAAKGDLQEDDLITTINGQLVHSLADLKNILQPLPAGTAVTFRVERKGSPQSLTVTLGQRPPPDQRRFQTFGKQPDAAPGGDSGQAGPEQLGAGGGAGGGMTAPRMGASSATGGRPLLGVRTMPVTEQDRLRLGLQSTAGAHVTARTLNSPAERANIPLDAVITALNGEPVDSPTDLSALLARAGAGSEVQITYIYNGNATQARVVLGGVGESRDIGRQGMGSSVMANPPAANNPGVSAPRALSGGRNLGTYPGNSSMPPPQPTPPQSQQGGPMYSQRQSDAARIEALERRVQELEQKVQELESRPPRGT